MASFLPIAGEQAADTQIRVIEVGPEPAKRIGIDEVTLDPQTTICCVTIYSPTQHVENSAPFGLE